MIIEETMPRDEALAELRAVDARVRVWSPGWGRQTIYGNGPRGETLAAIWCSSAGYVNEDAVWRAVWRHVKSQGSTR